jgi:hypothetical protein
MWPSRCVLRALWCQAQRSREPGGLGQRGDCGAGAAPNLGLQATANSLRSCVASAISGA